MTRRGAPGRAANGGARESHGTALLLTGGGARAAYQVGVLNAIRIIRGRRDGNPFAVLCGTSAGAINATTLASYAGDFNLGVRKLAGIWANFHVGKVFHVGHSNQDDPSSWSVRFLPDKVVVEWEEPGAPAASADLELYDYEKDPAEKRNLDNTDARTVAKLREILARHPEARPPM